MPEVTRLAASGFVPKVSCIITAAASCLACSILSPGFFARTDNGSLSKSADWIASGLYRPDYALRPAIYPPINGEAFRACFSDSQLKPIQIGIVIAIPLARFCRRQVVDTAFGEVDRIFAHTFAPASTNLDQAFACVLTSAKYWAIAGYSFLRKLGYDLPIPRKQLIRP